MPNLLLRNLSIAPIFCLLTLAGRCQGANWKPLHYGIAGFSYPADWHINKEKRGRQTRVTMTPDSMQQLGMRMIEIYDLPTSETHTFAFFKRNFRALLDSSYAKEGKIVKISEIVFKGRNTMYGELIDMSLPLKVYGIDAGTDVYLIIITQRRYSRIADPRLERDEAAILNGIQFDH